MLLHLNVKNSMKKCQVLTVGTIIRTIGRTKEDVVAVSTDFTGSITSTANHQILQGVITGGSISTDYFITFELLHYLFNIGWTIVLKIL